MDDGIIELETARVDELGFTSDKFGGYLWKERDAIIISFIECIHPGRGDFKRLCQGILSRGLAVEIPAPLGKMQGIVKRAGYVKSFRSFHPPDIMDAVEVWRKEAP